LAVGEVITKTGKARRVAITALLLPAVFSMSMAYAEEVAKHVETAKTFVTQMAESKFDKAIEPFDQTMSQALPAEKLKTGLGRADQGKWCFSADNRNQDGKIPAI